MSGVAGSASPGLAWRLARRELRGGMRSRFRGFRVFLACLVLGTATIAAVGSVSRSLEAGIAGDARALLGGDIEVQTTHHPVTPAQLAWLRESGTVSEVIELRAMARNPGAEALKLVELKAVDDSYPLVGTAALAGGRVLADALARRDGVYGIVVDKSLLIRLGVSTGDRVALGETEFRIGAVLETEPDRATRGIQLGPRAMVSLAGLQEAALLRPGSLAHFLYRVILPPETGAELFKTRLSEAFPDAAWRVRDPARAAPGLQRFIERMTMFLTLVGLSALLIGGVGVGNAVHAFLAQRGTTIATLKCLGAPARLVFRVYILQIMTLAAGGILIGLLIGAIAPLLAFSSLADLLPVPPKLGLYPEPLLLAAAFGFLTALVFSLWPLMRAREVPAAGLFRQTVAPPGGRPAGADLAVLGGLILALAGLTVLSAHDNRLALWFVGGAAASMAAFRLAAVLVVRAARAWPRPRRPRLRLAIANLHRPGAPTASVVLSLGLGITVLVAITMTERNLDRQINEIMAEQAPAFFFIDIQPSQAKAFEKLVESMPGAGAVRRVPMLRGRITAIAGTPVGEITPPEEYAWVVRGDRGLTWSREPPRRGNRVVEGEWWPADYTGPTLVSLEARVARAYGIGIGDSLTFNILGRAFKTRIANLREIDWTSLGVNFVVIFSPGALQRAPQISIATVHIDEAGEDALEAAVTKQFPNVSAIRVRDVLDQVNGIMGSIDLAVKVIALIAIAAGVLVLAGAVAAGRRQRIYDAVVLKTLGATRRDILAAYLIEFLLLGLVTAGIAAGAGSVAAWAVTTEIMHLNWSFTPGAMLATTALCVAVTLIFGILGAWRALGGKAAPLLRSE